MHLEATAKKSSLCKYKNPIPQININRVDGESRKLTWQLMLLVIQAKISEIILDSSISLTFQIQSSNKCQLYLQNIARICTLPTTPTANIVQDSVISHLNFCNSLLLWSLSASTIALFSLLPHGILMILLKPV